MESGETNQGKRKLMRVRNSGTYRISAFELLNGRLIAYHQAHVIAHQTKSAQPEETHKHNLQAQVSG